MDLADLAQVELEAAEQRRYERLRKYELPVGIPGECDDCGEHCARLVCGLCAACRDWDARARRQREQSPR